jgi:hypothetical protein
VVRSEACAADFYAALDAAAAKLESRLRRAADRRRVHYGQRRPQSVLDAIGADLEPAPSTSLNGTATDGDAAVGDQQSAAAPAADLEPADDTLGRVVREKAHDADPMSVDQALHEMELVGHDFYLFADAESGLPSVVYRRKGYAYGVIRLGAQLAPALPPEPRHAPQPSAADTTPAQPRAFAART